MFNEPQMLFSQFLSLKFLDSRVHVDPMRISLVRLYLAISALVKHADVFKIRVL